MLSDCASTHMCAVRDGMPPNFSDNADDFETNNQIRPMSTRFHRFHTRLGAARAWIDDPRRPRMCKWKGKASPPQFLDQGTSGEGSRLGPTTTWIPMGAVPFVSSSRPSYGALRLRRRCDMGSGLPVSFAIPSMPPIPPPISRLRAPTKSEPISGPMPKFVGEC